MGFCGGGVARLELTFFFRGGFAAVGIGWGQSGFAALSNPLPLILSATCGAIGLQNILGGFVLAIIAGNESQFAPKPAVES